jgi:hypothetical protein
MNSGFKYLFKGGMCYEKYKDGNFSLNSILVAVCHVKTIGQIVTSG